MTHTGADYIKDSVTTSHPGMVTHIETINRTKMYHYRQTKNLCPMFSPLSAQKLKENKNVAQALKDFGLRISKLLVSSKVVHLTVNL